MVGERLAELRTKKNMTQEEFADYMGVTRQSVSKWELNKTFPDVEKVIRISELYDVSIDYILKGVESGENINKTASSSKCNEKIVDGNVSFPISENQVRDYREEELQATKVNKKTGLMVSVCITSIFTVFILLFLVFCMARYRWIMGDDIETGVRVEAVYQQLSLVEISGYNQDGDYVSETIFLDTQGVRSGDYIYADIDGDNISISYKLGTILGVLIIFMLMVIALVLQVRELRKHE